MLRSPRALLVPVQYGTRELAVYSWVRSLNSFGCMVFVNCSLQELPVALSYMHLEMLVFNASSLSVNPCHTSGNTNT